MDRFPSLPETRVLPWVRLLRERKLPALGQVITTIGKRVDPLDVIARATPPKETRAIPLTRIMGLRERDLPKHLHKHVGDTLEAREIIISKRINLFNERLIYRAPAPGRIVALQGSWMLLELDVTPVEQLALYRGLVTNVIPRVGVTIEAEGAWMQGVWGSGQEGYGVLKMMAREPGEPLTVDRIDINARGMVLAAGTLDSAEALEAAARVRAAGLVVGSLAPALRTRTASLGLPVLVTEGFGRAPLAAPIFELLNQFNGNEASLNTTTRSESGEGILRPEIFIPRVRAGNEPEAQPPAALGTQIGASVRVTREPWLGQVGHIVGVPETARLIESGARVSGADIDLLGGRTFVPWTNLELIG